MAKRSAPALLLGALAIAAACSNDGGGTSTATGGRTGTGGTTTGGTSGSGAEAGSGASSASGGDGAGGAGNASGGGTAGDGGEGATGESGATGEGGEGGGECAPESGDEECARCMRQNCCTEWAACEADSNCNACGECLDATGSFLGCISMCSYVGEDATGSMINCGCEPDAGSLCTGPCAAACGFG